MWIQNPSFPRVTFPSLLFSYHLPLPLWLTHTRILTPSHPHTLKCGRLSVSTGELCALQCSLPGRGGARWTCTVSAGEWGGGKEGEGRGGEERMWLMLVWFLFRLTCVLANKATLPDVIQVGTYVLHISHFVRLDTCPPSFSDVSILCSSVWSC